MSDSVTPWTVAHQAPPSMGFSRQEYWNGLPFPSPGDLPDPGIKPRSPALQADALTSEPPGKPLSLPYANWASQEGCLFHLRFSFQSSDFLLFHFCGLFLSLSFSHHRFRLLFPIQGFPGDSISKESACLGSISGLGRSPGEENGFPLQYSCLENSMDYTVRGVTKSQTQLRDFHSLPI